MRRVAITGLGIVTPFGAGVTTNWKALYEGRSAISKLIGPEFSGLSCRIAGQIPALDNKSLAAHPKWAQYALLAGSEAINQSGVVGTVDSIRFAVCAGMGMSAIEDITDTYAIALSSSSYRSVSPYFIPKILSNYAAALLGMEFDARGPSLAYSTACAAGLHSIIDGVRLIQSDDADVVLAGASESCTTPLSIAAFAKMKALCTDSNDAPELASRPFDLKRSGFAVSEGAGFLVIEELERAEKRKAPVIGEIVGYGMSCDAYKIANPRPDGSSAFDSMKMALKKAKLDPSALSYVNAHATSTPIGDAAECTAISRTFGKYKPYVSSYKGHLGHLLGAAGSAELVMSIASMSHSILIPTLNLNSTDLDQNFVKSTPMSQSIDYLLKNSFGFGGTNASIIVQNVPRGPTTLLVTQ